jgi:tetratricopeptide (TPR) repeat protein
LTVSPESAGPAGGADINVGVQILHVAVHGSAIGRDSVVNAAGRTINTLPPRVVHFVGRNAELHQLTTLLCDERPGSSRIIVISGMPASGKTALAIEAAHRVSNCYPDGILFLSVAGRADPAEALTSALLTLGIAPNLIPESIHDRTLLFRSLLGRRRQLVVLDDVSDIRHISPLILEGSECRFVLTARARLNLLQQAYNIHLEVLRPEDSIRLFRRLVGDAEGAGVSDESLLPLVDLLGGLPLAIRMVAARYIQHQLTPGQIVAELQSVRIAAAAAGNAYSVRSAFDLTYRALSATEARAFRMLSLFPGQAIRTEAAAALLACSSELTRELLYALVRSAFLNESEPGVFRLHDLLRLYAGTLLEEEGDSDGSHDAMLRLRGWYLGRARRAVQAIRSTPGATFPPDDRQSAMLWLEAERSNLVVLSTVAASEPGYTPDDIPLFADTLYPFFSLRGYWTDCQATHESALRVARASDDAVMAERVLNNLGVAYREQHLVDEAIACFQESLSLSRKNGSESTRALTLMNLGAAYREAGADTDAIACHESALAIARDRGLTEVIGKVLSNVGNVYRRLSQTDEALKAYQEGITYSRAAGDLQSQGITLMNLGQLYQDLRRDSDAWSCFEQSLEIARSIGDRVGEGRALRTLGAGAALRGQTALARDALERSIRIAEDVADPETLRVAYKDLGDLELSAGYAERATSRYLLSREAARRLGDLSGEAEVTVALARVSQLHGNNEEASTHWHDAVQAFGESSNPQGRATALSEMAAFLHSTGQADEAIVRYEESAAIAREIADAAIELGALDGLVQSLATSGQSDELDVVHARASELRRKLERVTSSREVSDAR